MHLLHCFKEISLSRDQVQQHLHHLEHRRRRLRDRRRLHQGRPAQLVPGQGGAAQGWKVRL